MPKHTVDLSEHIAKIIFDLGFYDCESIWNDSNNTQLKDLRENGNILLPGDELYYPDKEQRSETSETEHKHCFTRKLAKLNLRIVVRDFCGQPLKKEVCDLILGNETVSLTTDKNGLIEHDIHPTLKHAKLLVPSLNAKFALIIGAMDPINTETGQRARLNNMGYFSGYSDEDGHQLTWAIEEFQFENKIKPLTGTMDEETQTALKEKYGC